MLILMVPDLEFPAIMFVRTLLGGIVGPLLSLAVRKLPAEND